MECRYLRLKWGACEVPTKARKSFDPCFDARNFCRRNRTSPRPPERPVAESIRRYGTGLSPGPDGLDVFGARNAQGLRTVNLPEQNLRRELAFLAESGVEPGNDRLLDLGPGKTFACDRELRRIERRSIPSALLEVQHNERLAHICSRQIDEENFIKPAFPEHLRRKHGDVV